MLFFLLVYNGSSACYQRFPYSLGHELIDPLLEGDPGEIKGRLHLSIGNENIISPIPSFPQHLSIQPLPH